MLQVKMECFICSKNFSNIEKYLWHLQTFHGFQNSDTFRCTICNSAFTTKSSFKRHLTKVHREVFVEKHCGSTKKLPSQSDFRNLEKNILHKKYVPKEVSIESHCEETSDSGTLDEVPVIENLFENNLKFQTRLVCIP